MNSPSVPIAKTLDHSILSPNATADELRAGCEYGRDAQVASVCLLPWFVSEADQILSGSGVKVCTVVAFPHGTTSISAKRSETELAIDEGCEEVDLVINRGRVHDGDWKGVEREINTLTEVAHDGGAKIKWIFETCDLSDDQIKSLCKICSEAGVDWVKTSTGFGKVGATESGVAMMRANCPENVSVKASGGIRDLETVRKFLALGANRIGTSGSQRILDALAAEGGADA